MLIYSFLMNQFPLLISVSITSSNPSPLNHSVMIVMHVKTSKILSIKALLLKKAAISRAA